MSDPAIGDTIIAAIGSEDTPLLQMAAVVAGLERAGFKIIPRAQYEALMVAAKALKNLCHDGQDRYWGDAIAALAALRAAGIDLEDKT